MTCICYGNISRNIYCGDTVATHTHWLQMNRSHGSISSWGSRRRRFEAGRWWLFAGREVDSSMHCPGWKEEMSERCSHFPESLSEGARSRNFAPEYLFVPGDWRLWSQTVHDGGKPGKDKFIESLHSYWVLESFVSLNKWNAHLYSFPMKENDVCDVSLMLTYILRALQHLDFPQRSLRSGGAGCVNYSILWCWLKFSTQTLQRSPNCCALQTSRITDGKHRGWTFLRMVVG